MLPLPCHAHPTALPCRAVPPVWRGGPPRRLEGELADMQAEVTAAQAELRGDSEADEGSGLAEQRTWRGGEPAWWQ